MSATIMRRLAVLVALASGLVPVAGLPSPAGAVTGAVTGAATGALACHGWQVVPSPAPTSSTLPASTLRAAAATSRRNAWAVGDMLNPAQGASEPLTEHWDGSAWSVVPFPAIPGAVSEVNSLLGVTALSRTNAWAVGIYLSSAGSRPLIAHWNGIAGRSSPARTRARAGVS